MVVEDRLLNILSLKVSSRHCALLVIDVQNDFAATGGFFHQVGADVDPLQNRVIPNINRLVDSARRAGVTVIFVKSHYDAQYLSAPMRERNERLGKTMPRCITGSWGADFCGVAPADGEPVVVKHRYSAMLGSNLGTVLKERGIESLLLTGIATDTCVESTARDAYFQDYYVTLVADCCGAASAEDHNMTLPRFTRDYGLVVNASDVMAIWDSAEDDAATRMREEVSAAN